ncbi:MAG TPA: prepilin-type N-terminal cleavage/methylation domain-containing protein [Terriglobales bacterium]|nr:prepilin-type N-terminal cleavage/methylation domain-containing protein [Terriglobales bacterium]
MISKAVSRQLSAVSKTGFERTTIASASLTSESGFTMIEVMISMFVLTIGLLSMLAMFSVALAATNNAQEDMEAKQLAQATLESIFTARNTAQITFGQIQNVANGGIFLDGPQVIKDPGPDGLDGTADDLVANASCPGPSTCLQLAGSDGVLGTADDVWLPLNNFQRTITISPVFLPPPPGGGVGALDDTLRSITVTITYTTTQFRSIQKSYSVGAYVSSFR